MNFYTWFSRKKHAFLAGAFLIFVGFAFYALANRSTQKSHEVHLAEDGRVQVVASFYPLAYFARAIGGEFVSVTNITPMGMEPHEYEPTPLELVKTHDADLFLFNGNGIDVWADRISNDLQNEGVDIVRMVDHVDVMETDGADTGEGVYDPHIWLDPTYAEKEVQIIADQLSQIDPAHTDQYAINRDRFLASLQALDKEYQTGLATCENRTIVTTHNAFRYLARRYHLETLYVLGLSPEEEPSSKRIAEIADLAKSRGIKYIFFESLVSPAFADTIASEIGADTLVLNPIEGLTKEEQVAGEDYLSLMRSNLAHLKTALVCQTANPS